MATTELPNIIQGFIPKNQRLILDSLNPIEDKRRIYPMATKELKFNIKLTVKSTRGISLDRAMLGILRMEINSNLEGDPRYHFTVVEEVKEEK